MLDASLNLQTEEGLPEVLSHLPQAQKALQTLAAALKNNLDSIQLGPGVIIENPELLPKTVDEVRRGAALINMQGREDMARRVSALDKLREIRAMVDVENDLIR